MPSIRPPQAFSIILRSTAGNFRSRSRLLPTSISGSEISRPLVVVVPLHVVTGTRLDGPEGNDSNLRIVVEAVSSRKNISEWLIRTFTKGKPSQRWIGMSSGVDPDF